MRYRLPTQARAIRRDLDLARVAITICLAVFEGCGPVDGLHRQSVSGIVTLDGQPLAAGAIHFEPEPNQAITAVGATIRDGVFTIAKSQGPIPGSYIVRIYASSGTQPTPAKGQTEHSRRPMVEQIPDKYNANSELRASVTIGGPNHWRFELLSVSRKDSD